MVSYMADRFGIPQSVFDRFWLFRKQRSWWLLHKTAYLERCKRLKIARVGLRAFQKIGPYVKPSTRVVQVLGHHATKGTLELHDDQVRRLFAGETIPFGEKLENGYVILSFKHHILGLGLLIDGKVRSQIPRKQIQSIGGL